MSQKMPKNSWKKQAQLLKSNSLLFGKNITSIMAGVPTHRLLPFFVYRFPVGSANVNHLYMMCN